MKLSEIEVLSWKAWKEDPELYNLCYLTMKEQIDKLQFIPNEDGEIEAYVKMPYGKHKGTRFEHLHLAALLWYLESSGMSPKLWNGLLNAVKEKIKDKTYPAIKKPEIDELNSPLQINPTN